MTATQNRIWVELPLAGRRSFTISKPLGASYQDRLDPMERAYNLRHLRSNLYSMVSNLSPKHLAFHGLYANLPNLSAESIESLSALSWSVEERIPALITPKNVDRLLEGSQEARETFVLMCMGFIAKQGAEWFPFCETREGIIARLEASVKGSPLFGYQLRSEFPA